MQDINEFLSSYPSQGPQEAGRTGSEFSTFDQPDLDIKFLLTLLRENHRLHHVLCVPDFAICASMDGSEVFFHHKLEKCQQSMHVRAGILLLNRFSSQPKVWLPKNLKSFVCHCRRHKKRFLVCNTGIYAHDDLRQGHSNALIIDIRDHIIERYDSEGRDNSIDKAFKHAFHAILPDYRYIGTTFLQNVQRYSDSFTGMCVTFSLYYTLLRLINDTKSSREVREFMLRHTPEEMRSVSLRLNKHVLTTLRKYPSGVLMRSKRNSRKKNHSEKKLKMSVGVT